MFIVLIVLATYAIAWCALALSDRHAWSGLADDACGIGADASETTVEHRQAA